MGSDFLKDDHEKIQTEVLWKQLEIALYNLGNKPVIIHCSRDAASISTRNFT